MSVPFFDITRQNAQVEKELDAAIKKVVSSGRYILGENVADLEKEFAAYCGTKYAVGVASGTDALHLALRSLDLKEGDEVLTSPFTFIATAEAITYCGAKPVFVDIEPNTFNLNPDRIEERLTSKTKAILPVHIFGQACEMDKIMAIAQKHNLAVIEDCAQAFGATFNKQQIGSFGQVGCFSFFPTKNLGCFGDGGMISTNDEKIADLVRALRAHGARKTYHHDLIGYNSRLDELQAAVLRVKLPYLHAYLKSRRKNADRYRQLLADLPQLILPFAHPLGEHTYNQFTLMTKYRDDLVAFLKAKNIGTMVYYPLPLHLQPVYSYLGRKKGDFPNCEAAQATVFSLPIFPELRNEEIVAVSQAIHSFFQQ